MNKIRPIIFVLLLITLAVGVRAQFNVKSGNLNFKFPGFIDDKLSPKGDTPLFVKKKIIPPINKSSANIEIRVYKYTSPDILTGVTIISCENGKISKKEYDVWPYLSLPQTAMIDGGPLDEYPGHHFYYKVMPQKTLSATYFKNTLNRLNQYNFTLHDPRKVPMRDTSIHSNVLYCFPTRMDDYEIKIGNHYKRFYTGIDFWSDTTTADYKRASKIYDLMHNL